VYVRIPVPEYQTSIIFQASGLKVNYESYDIFLKKDRIIEEYNIAVTDKQYERSEKLRVTEAGKPYSKRELIGFIYVLFMRRFGKQVNNPFSDGSQAYVCVDIGADQIGFDTEEKMTPEDFRRWCRSRYTPDYVDPTA
jgi:hypothetical protein